jgi:Rap1a immunity proteins
LGRDFALCLLARPAVADITASSALEMESSCKFIDTAPLRLDGTIGIPDTSRAGYCWGAFAAIQQLSLAADHESGAKTLEICRPANSTEAQYIKIFLRYVERHPEEAHLLFAQVALYALQEAFPCAAGVPSAPVR